MKLVRVDAFPLRFPVAEDPGRGPAQRSADDVGDEYHMARQGWRSIYSRRHE